MKRVCIPVGRHARSGPWAVVDGNIKGRYATKAGALHVALKGQTLTRRACLDALTPVPVSAPPEQRDLFA